MKRNQDLRIDGKNIWSFYQISEYSSIITKKYRKQKKLIFCSLNIALDLFENLIYVKSLAQNLI
jgi:hypothetical protein